MGTHVKRKLEGSPPCVQPLVVTRLVSSVLRLVVEMPDKALAHVANLGQFGPMSRFFVHTPLPGCLHWDPIGKCCGLGCDLAFCWPLAHPWVLGIVPRNKLVRQHCLSVSIVAFTRLPSLLCQIFWLDGTCVFPPQRLFLALWATRRNFAE